MFDGPTSLPYPIPDGILLLVHLHLLDWPTDDVCDPNMFNATSHGIGDRIKTMERVIYFLIAKSEGDQHAKTVSERKTPCNLASSR